MEDDEEDGPGLGVKRKSPTGMSIRKHADALRIKDPNRSPNSSHTGSNNVSRDQQPSNSVNDSNRASNQDVPSSK